jgi:hypothetical protein
MEEVVTDSEKERVCLLPKCQMFTKRAPTLTSFLFFLITSLFYLPPGPRVLPT